MLEEKVELKMLLKTTNLTTCLAMVKIQLNGSKMITRGSNEPRGVWEREGSVFIYSPKGTPSLTRVILSFKDFHHKPLVFTFNVGLFSNFWRLTPNHQSIVPLTSEGHF